MRLDGNNVPQTGCIQPAFVRYQPRLGNIRILASLSMCELTTVLRTRPPVGEEGEEEHIGCLEAGSGHWLNSLV